MGAGRSELVRGAIMLTTLALAACGGGGGGGTSSALPPAPPPPAVGGSSQPVSATRIPVSVTISVPGVATSARTRLPKYVSAGTKSAQITAGGVSQVVNCSTVCTLTVTVTPGQQTFVAALYDAPNGTGHVLSQGQASANIVAGAANTVNLVFGGVVASLSVSFATASATAGPSGSTAVSVQAKDAAGYTIVGSDPFVNPVALSDDDGSGATQLSTTTVGAPGSPVTLHYSGAAVTAHITASSTGVLAASATFTVSPAASPTPAPTAAPPSSYRSHVQSFAYYGINGINASVPASTMASLVDVVEDDGYTAQSADAFKKAGGRMAIAYTDPTYAYYCAAPLAPPAGACTGQVGQFVSDESAFLHNAAGQRVANNTNSRFLYEEILNPGSASVQAAYAQAARVVLSASPLLDGLMADDSGSPFSTPGGALGSNLYDGFSNGPGVEITSDQQYIAGEEALLAAPGKPVFINGGDPSTLGPAYNGTFIDQTNVLGQEFEGCFNNGGNYLYSDANGNQFQREVNGLLAVQAHRKFALCLPTGSSTDPAKRLYAYASWLLAYDPQYSVYGMEIPQSDGAALYPEIQLVPTQPRVTATDVAQLRNGGVYVREFSACAIAGTAIGPCAAVVNTSTSASASLPSLSTAYAHSIVLGSSSLAAGGKVTVGSGAPGSLAPQTAAILVQ